MTNFIVGKPSKVKCFLSLHTSCGIALMLNHVHITLLRDRNVDFQSKIIDEELSFSLKYSKIACKRDLCMESKDQLWHIVKLLNIVGPD